MCQRSGDNINTYTYTIYTLDHDHTYLGGSITAREMAVAGGNSVRSIADGCLFTVEERLETFKESHWAFTSGSCTPLRVKLNL